MRLLGSSDVGQRGRSRRPSVVSILDVGSTKIVCLIARVKPIPPGADAASVPEQTHSIEILGIGHQRSRGIKSGIVIDLARAEQAIRLAVDAAERMAGVTVGSVIVNLSCGRLSSETYSASIDLSGRAVSETEIGRVLAVGRHHSVSRERSIVHSLPIGYSLDVDNGIADPRGMMGRTLGVDMHMVTADTPPFRNLELCINRCHLSIETIVASSYASGLSVLVEDEAELGCVCVDLGGGTTTMGVFSRGQFVHVDAIAVGGQHITMDIARGLSTRLEDAERLKTVHGSALSGTGDDREILSVPVITDDEHELPNQIPRSALIRIIRPRIEEILELVRDRLNASGFAALVGRRLVLTGGGSELTGLAEVARRVLARNVRLGRPLGITGLPEVARGPAFATSVGLLIYPQVAEMEQFDSGRAHFAMTGTDGYFARVGRWFTDSF